MKLNTNNAVNRNSFKKSSILKDRVQKTSRKLDNMKLTDDDAPKTNAAKTTANKVAAAKNNNCPGIDNGEVLSALLLHHEQTNVSALDKNSSKVDNCTDVVDGKDDISSDVANDLKSIKLMGRDEENNRIRRVGGVANEEGGDSMGTQGDQLNKIKAMRRRHSRSVNVSTSL